MARAEPGGNNEGTSILQARRAQGLDRRRCRPVCLSFARRSTRGDRDHAGSGRGCAEGRKVNYYISIDLPLAEKIARSFEAAFPGVSVRVERSGAERVFQRIGQEYASRIYGVEV